MSIAWTPNPPKAPRGAAAVGMLAELPALERLSVQFFRLWCDGEDGRTSVAAAFSSTQSPAHAVGSVNAFADLMQLMLKNPRRPIMRHNISCACIGGDEAAFAHMIACAVVDREDAMAFALTLMQPGAACQAVEIAQEVGLCLLGLSRFPIRH